MSILTNANEFLKNSDFPMDKVIFMASGSTTVGAHSSTDESVAHNLNFTPLPLASWSPSSSFAVSYEETTGPRTGGSFIQFVTSYSDETNVTISCVNGGGSSYTFYWRVYCFEPSDKNELAPYTSSSSTNYIINTDYNYSKLYLADVFHQAAVGGTPVIQTVAHNLQYYPQVMIWQHFYSSNRTVSYKVAGLGLLATEMIASISTTTLSFQFESSSEMDVHYRIYTDAAE